MTEPTDNTPKSSKPIKDRVAAVLAEIRPLLQGDGGDVELVEVTDDNVGTGPSDGGVSRAVRRPR